VRQRARAVGGAAVEDAAVVRMNVVLGRAVQQHVEMGADMHVAQLERTGQRDDERDVLADRLVASDSVGVRGRARREPARERRVGMDVELEQMEEWVGDDGDGAVNFPLDAVLEL